MRVVRPGLTEGHGITLVRERETQRLLRVTDPGFVFLTNDGDGDDEWATLFGKGVLRGSRAPRVVKMTLDGEILFELPLPPTDADASPGIMIQVLPLRVGNRRRAVWWHRRRVGSRWLWIQRRPPLRQGGPTPSRTNRRRGRWAIPLSSRRVHQPQT